MITNVPTINGPSNLNSVIYGLNLNTSYSSSPSKLTLNYVSADGNYQTPTLGASATVTFGNFTFNGKIWGSNLKESAEQKTLDIELIDNSIILDQYYVLLWKRGLFKEKGVEEPLDKDYDFSDEKVLVPVKKNENTDYPYVVFEEKSLSRETVTRKRRKLANNYDIKGNVILVGKESFPESYCDIPDTYYVFDNLSNAIKACGISTYNMPGNSLLKGTHEGTLREVLNNWCADLGYDFFWDYSNNSIYFYSVSKGILTQLPTSNSSKIISKETSNTKEGTFAQFGMSYTIKPKSPYKSLSYSNTIVSLISIGPMSISYLLKRNGEKGNEFTTTRDTYGKSRNQSKFMASALTGYVSRALRDFYCMENNFWEVLGYNFAKKKVLDNSKMINFLNANGFRDLIQNLQNENDETLSGYFFYGISYDESLADKWYEIEQELLQNIGKYYRIPNSSSTFFYCTDKTNIEINITVDPEGNDVTFKDDTTVKKVFVRSGTMSHDQVTLLEELNFDENSKDIARCKPTHILLKEGGLINKLITEKILDKKDIDSLTHLVIMPKYKDIIDPIINLSVSESKGINEMETTWSEQKTNNVEEARKNCEDLEQKLIKARCTPAVEEAREKALKRLNVPSNDEKSRDNYVSGLTAKGAWRALLKFGGQSVEFYSPSDAKYQTVTTYNITVNKLTTEEEFLSFSTNIPTSRITEPFSEIRIINNNSTETLEDYFGLKLRDASSIPLSPVINATTAQQTVKYVFAGQPEGLTLSPKNGLTNLDISLSSEGFTSSVTFSTRPPKQSKADNIMRVVNSQLNRASFNAI